MADTCINIFDTIYLYFFSEAVDNIIELNFDDLVSIYFFLVQKILHLYFYSNFQVSLFNFPQDK